MNVRETALGVLVEHADWLGDQDIAEAAIHPQRHVLVERAVYHFLKGLGEMPMYTVVGRNTYYLSGLMSQRTVIGRYCSISHRVDIGGTAHDTGGLATGYLQEDFVAEMVALEREPPAENDPITVIGCDVWIGVGAFVKGGTKVGHGAVIGGHSVVTKDVPPYAVVGGNPARIIRYRFDDETIARLLRSAWWTLPRDEVARLPKGNVEEALKRIEAFRQGRKSA